MGIRSHRRCTERAEELGHVGASLLDSLPTNLELEFLDYGLGRQASTVLGGPGTRHSFVERLAISVLCCEVPIQIGASSSDVAIFCNGVLSPLSTPVPECIHLGKNVSGMATYRTGPFDMGETKANVRFGDAYRDLCKTDPALAKRYRELSGYTVALTDAQATAVLIYGRGLDGTVTDPICYALRALLYPQDVKALNVVIKGAGLNATQAGAMLCEALSLQGRGVANIDLKEKTLERVHAPGAAGAMPNIEPSDLRRHIRKVLEIELEGKRVEFDDTSQFWGKRWLWAVNGGHSRMRERVDPRWAVQLKGRLHRRAVMEAWVNDPIPDWDGRVFVASSAKYEHGKTRLIMACDTVSYVAFEHLLRPVEQAWRNKRTLLDPGRLGHYGMAQRVRSLSEKGGNVWVMLDYDDFNAQHTLGAQKVVIEELVRLTHYPEHLGRKLVDSFGKMWASSGDSILGRVTATLMSGHRGTTFLNSVLNSAYIRLGYGPDWDHLASMHTGDDVVMAVPTFAAAADLVSRVLSTGVRMNPMKQSIGSVTAEFLRVAVGRRGARGYLARAVASAISGTWTSPTPLEGPDVMRNMAQSARTLVNRSGSTRLPLLLLTALRRRTGVGMAVARGVLLGDLAVGDGPCYSASHRFQKIDPIPIVRTAKPGRFKGMPMHATHEYLAEHATPVEQAALIMADTSVVLPMLSASYSKMPGLDGEGPCPGSVRYRRSRKVAARGSVTPSELAWSSPDIGVLQRYPLLAFLRSRLNLSQVIELIGMAGQVPGMDPLLTAWGAEARGVVISGTLSFSDASSFCRRTTEGVILVDYPVAV